MDSVSKNAQIRNEVAQLWDRYTVLMSLAAAATDPAIAARLRHEAQRVWHEWLAKSEVLIIRDSYERRLGD